MYELSLTAGVIGAVLIPIIEFLKSKAPWINGWRTWIVALILSALSAWFQSTTVAEPMPLAATVMLGVMVFIVAIGGNIVIAKNAGKPVPTLKVNSPNGQ